MSPPTYGDLGKSCRDVFGKGYHFGIIKLDVKTKTPAGVEFNTSGTSNQDSGKVAGNLETKYRFKERGITFTEKWNTDNNISCSVDVQDQLMKGLKVSVESQFNPAQNGAKSGKLKAEFKHDQFSANGDMNLASSPLINGSVVFGHNGWLAGYQMAFDSGKSKLTKNNFGLGYSVGDFAIHGNVNDGQTFGGTVYQRVNAQLETGINLGWQGNSTNFGVGCKYNLDRDASIRAKVNNNSQVGLGYQQRLRDGVTLTLSTMIDGKNFNQGAHKIGMALELSA